MHGPSCQCIILPKVDGTSVKMAAERNGAPEPCLPESIIASAIAPFVSDRNTLQALARLKPHRSPNSVMGVRQVRPREGKGGGGGKLGFTRVRSLVNPANDGAQRKSASRQLLSQEALALKMPRVG